MLFLLVGFLTFVFDVLMWVFLLVGFAEEVIRAGDPRAGKRREKCATDNRFLCNLVRSLHFDGSRT